MSRYRAAGGTQDEDRESMLAVHPESWECSRRRVAGRGCEDGRPAVERSHSGQGERQVTRSKSSSQDAGKTRQEHHGRTLDPGSLRYNLGADSSRRTVAVNMRGNQDSLELGGVGVVYVHGIDAFETTKMLCFQSQLCGPASEKTRVKWNRIQSD